MADSSGRRRVRRLVSSLILITVALSFVIWGCDEFYLEDVLGSPDGETSEALLILPESLVLPASQQYVFEASGGTPPYEFSITAGSGTVDPDTGLFTAPTTAGMVVVQVLDNAENTSNSNVNVVQSGDSLVISPSTASIRINESVPFSASGGSPPYTFALFGDGTLSPENVYKAPATSGSATITVTDDAANTRSATITVAPDSPLSISPSAISIPTGSGAVRFTGYAGIPPYFFSIAPAPPDGGTGSQSGHHFDYLAPGSGGAFTVTVTDSDSPPVSASATVVVQNSAPEVLTVYPSAVTIYVNSTLSFTAIGGTSPYQFTASAGSGVTSGIDDQLFDYSAPGIPGPVMIGVTDDLGESTSATVTVIEPLSISPPSVAVSVDGVVDFAASGGTGGYSYAVTAGGGTIHPTTGQYTAPGAPGSATVTLNDSAGNTAHAAITVTAPQALAISPSIVTVLESDTVLFVASGGAGGYAFSKVSGPGLIDAGTGVYTAPASSGTAIIRVTDAAGNRSDATVSIVADGALSISPPAAIVPVGGTLTFSASGGAPPYLYSMASGPGSVNATSGVYTAPGSPNAATVRVTDDAGDTSDAIVAIEGAGCGQTYAEVEPNNDKNDPWVEVNDFGIELVPGCSVTITGNNEDDPDTFKFDPGSSTFVAIIVTWSGGDNRIDLNVRREDGAKVGESDSQNEGSETLLWPVDPSPGYKYLEIEKKHGDYVDYTITLSGS